MSLNIFLSLLPFCDRRINWVPDQRPQVPGSPKAKVVTWLVLPNGTWVELMHPTSESCPRKDETFPSLPSLYPLSGGWRVLGQLPWRQERKPPVKGAERLWLTSVEKKISFLSQYILGSLCYINLDEPRRSSKLLRRKNIPFSLLGSLVGPKIKLT